MAKKQVEIIKKIEAEFKNIKPTVLSSKRSAFLNKKLSAECFNTTEVGSPESQVLATHCWSICNIKVCGGRSWVTPNNPWIQGQQYGPFGFQTNPFNPSWTGTWSAQTPEFNAFYDWVVSEVGSINVGDTIQFDMTALNSGICNILGECAEILCFKYEGFLNWNNGFGWAVTSSILPIAIRDNCCDYIPNLCYYIGDVGPEGGIIFSVPGVGANTSTNMYYEVAQNDIDTAKTATSSFNVSCDPTGLATQFIVNAEALAYVAGNSLQFSITNPVNAPFVNNINSGIISAGTLVNTSVTPGNVLMFPTPSGNFGVPITNVIIGPSEITLEFNTVILAGYTPPLLTTVSFVNIITLDTGSEWGAYNQPTTAINTLPDFGIGIDNTYIIDTFPLQNTPCPVTPTGNCHPWLDTRDIAASVCIQQPAVLNDWFLPSAIEFKEIVVQVGSLGTNQITLNSFGQNSEHIYWTSSQYIDTNSGLQDPDKYSWAYNAGTNNMELAWRCHPLSVRPIRRFECEPEPCPPPYDCNFEYNYRDGYGQLDGGLMSSGGFITTPTMDPAQIHWNTTNEGCSPGTPPVNLESDSIIGGDELLFTALNRRDVLGNVHSDADFYNHTGYTISVWDTKYNFIGKWKYSTLHSLQSGAYIPGVQSGSPKYSYDRPGDDNYVILKLRDVQHLEGDYPVVYYAGKPDVPGSLGSHTAVFFKIEWDGNTGNYETGCNSTVFGNPHPYYSPGVPSTQAARDWPFYCGPLYLNNVYDRHVAIPRYATFQPFDLNSSTLLPVYPDIFAANSYLTPPYHSISQIWSNLSQPIGCGGVSTANHCFSVCAIQKTNGNWHPVPSPWFQQEPYGPIAMENNPQLGATTPPFSSNPAVDQDYTEFYNWIITQAPTLAIGDSFIFHTVGYTMQHIFVDPNGVVTTYSNVIATCYKYEGIQTYTLPCDILNDGYSLPLVGLHSCCLGPESTVSSSSLTKPTENNPNSIKIKVNAKTLTKREKFIKSKEPKKTGPFGIFGYYPLYDNIDDAIKNSPDSDYHIHEFGKQEFYMPEGLEMGVTQFHGDWAPEPMVSTEFSQPIVSLLNGQITPEVPEITVITPPPITIEPEEPEITYTPPPPSPSSSSGGGSGGGY